MEAIPAIKIEIGSVKVMRSYDYCHFEVCLTSSEANTAEKVDELRKSAARLADKAVVQYATAKCWAQHRTDKEFPLRVRAEEAKKTPEGERTAGQRADIKAYGDFLHEQRYDYQDDWQDEDES